MTDDPVTANLRRAASFERDGKFFEAEALYRQLAAIEPPHAMSRFQYGCFLLLKGEYADAWPLFQGRLESEFYRKKGTMQLPEPWWDGAPVPAGTVLIHTDQGIGDAILCARFLPLAVDRAGSLIVAVPKGLGRLFEGVDTRISVIEMGDPVPDFDVHMDMFSLAPLFEARPGNMPEPPYIAADPALAADWKARLAGHGLSVGLVWQGNPDHARDAERSIPLMDLMPVLKTPGVRFFGLQVGHGADQAAGLDEDLDFTDLGPELARGGMSVAAAAIANLDLLISVDTAPANLAGAMGRPLWVPVPMIPDWRWLMATGGDPQEFEPAPWYPTARVFRTPVRYDWASVIDAMAGELAALAGAG